MPPGGSRRIGHLFGDGFSVDDLWRDEDGHSDEDEVGGEYPEAESVNHHGSELPVVRLVGSLRLLLHLLSNKAQLIEDSQQLVPNPYPAHPLTHRPTRPSVTTPTATDVVARSFAVYADGAERGEVLHAGEEWDVVVDVLDVRDEAERRRSLRLEFAQAGLSQEDLVGEVAAGSRHAEGPREPFAD